MPKVTGIFDKFDNLDEIPIDDIARWLKPQPEHYLENFLANHLLYPQICPLEKQDLEIELAILKEALKRNPKDLTIKDHQIIISEEYQVRFPNLEELMMAFIDALEPKGVVKLVSENGQSLGTYLKIEFNGAEDLEIAVEGKRYKVKPGELLIVPSPRHSHINFNSRAAKIEGKQENFMEVAGGSLGIILDGRGS